MERSEKIKMLKDLQSGKLSIKELQPVSFVELHTFDSMPGFYFDSKGNTYNEEQKDELLRRKRQTSSLCFETIKQYQNQQS